jgi:peptidyl-prolyl cis-trans isomerase B (cyclophilin B)
MKRAWFPAVALVAAGLVAAAGLVGEAQTIPAARLAILVAADRPSPDARGLSTIRAGARSRDGETARVSIRALGRLRRSTLTPDITTGLRSALPEVRAEAADALAQALSGTPRPAVTVVDAVVSSLTTALAAETEARVRAVVLESIGRLPYRERRQIERAEKVLLSHSTSVAVMDRLGVAKGFETLIRLNAAIWQPGADTIAGLRMLMTPAESRQVRAEAVPVLSAESGHDARVRRLAVEALTAASALDVALMKHASTDADPQVRRLAVIAAERAGSSMVETANTIIRDGVSDRAPMVRVAAVHALNRRPEAVDVCQATIDATHDPEVQVAVAAFLNLPAACARSADLGSYLEQLVNSPEAQAPRGWIRTGRALEALAKVSPDRARPLVRRASEAPLPQIRLSAARAAGTLSEWDLLARLSNDEVGLVKSTARSALGTPNSDPQADFKPSSVASDLNATDLRRLAAPTARVTIRGLGAFDVALLTTEAPSTVLRFARLAEGGFFDGTMIGAGFPTLIHASPSLPEIGVASGRTLSMIPGEVGLWPHVRGTVGLSPHGDETRGAQVFVNLVDNPRFDHSLTVFAQVLNGVDVIDRIVEGDVIEKIEVLP